MTEPVAWRVEDVSETLGWRYSTLKPITKGYEPLYTAEQLHQRVKMTQKQLNAFTKWNKRNKLLSPVELIWNVMGANEYPNEFGLELQEVSRDDKYLLSLANIWSEFDPNNPEETIEIVPDMKWFVRSKERDINGYGWLSIIDKYPTPVYQYGHDIPLSMFVSFDTKEEAELWTNPLTEAVQLPVEDKR